MRWAYSSLADTSLVVGGVAAGFECVGAILHGISTAVNGHYWGALVTAPIAFFLCFAMLVLFIRVQNA